MTPERERKFMHVIDKRQPDLTIILENVFDPHNISAVLRSCDSVGVSEVYIITTQKPNANFFGKRSSASARKWVKSHFFENVESCFQAVREKFDFIYGTGLNQSAQSLYEMDFTQSVALVFGNEKDGVSEEALALCDGNFIIPQVGMIQSLNISVACAVSLYEVFRQRHSKGHYDQPKLESQQTKALFEEWHQRQIHKRQTNSK